MSNNIFCSNNYIIYFLLSDTWQAASELTEYAFNSSLIVPCRTNKAIQKCSPPILVVSRCRCRPHDCHPISLRSLSFCTPPPGCLWPALSSFAFWSPGQCRSADGIAISRHDMSDPSPSLYPYLYQQWQKLVGLSISSFKTWFSQKTLSVSFLCISCETLPVCICLQLWFSTHLPHTVRWPLHWCLKCAA